jgi:hypothetical protein
MNASENKRDYKSEHIRRKLVKKRFIVDMDIEKANAFTAYLKSQNITFTTWLNNHVNNELD